MPVDVFEERADQKDAVGDAKDAFPETFQAVAPETEAGLYLVPKVIE